MRVHTQCLAGRAGIIYLADLLILGLGRVYNENHAGFRANKIKAIEEYELYVYRNSGVPELTLQGQWVSLTFS